MYLLFDKYGIVRGQTSDHELLEPLRKALEFVGIKTRIAVRMSDGKIILS